MNTLNTDLNMIKSKVCLYSITFNSVFDLLPEICMNRVNKHENKDFQKLIEENNSLIRL